MIDLEQFGRALSRAVDSINDEGRKTTAMASTDIKRFADSFRQIKTNIESRMKQASDKLAAAEKTFHGSMDNAEAFIGHVHTYAKEVESLAVELGTNGGPPLDDTFPASPAPSGVDAMIHTQETLGRKHPSNQ